MREDIYISEYSYDLYIIIYLYYKLGGCGSLSFIFYGNLFKTEPFRVRVLKWTLLLRISDQRTVKLQHRCDRSAAMQGEFQGVIGGVWVLDRT